MFLFPTGLWPEYWILGKTDYLASNIYLPILYTEPSIREWGLFKFFKEIVYLLDCQLRFSISPLLAVTRPTPLATPFRLWIIVQLCKVKLLNCWLDLLGGSPRRERKHLAWNSSGKVNSVCIEIKINSK